ncbi:MAG TPA: hypothetical protein P5077_04345 [bacterium]|nr:hypothetical protein [bacterium]
MRIIGLSLLFVAFSLPLAADPLLVRGADGTYLPILAEGWTARSGGGVQVRLRKGVNPATVKERLAERFTDQTVEVRSGGIFISAVDLDAFQSAAAGFDVGVSLPQDPILKLREKQGTAEDIRVHRDQRVLADASDFAEVSVTSVSFSAVDGLVKLEGTVAVAPAGEFAKMAGAVKLHAFFRMKKRAVDDGSEENRRKADLLVVRQGSLLYLRIEGRDESGAYLVSEARLKKY